MAKDWSCGMGTVWDGWVWYKGAVWEQYWSGGMGSVWDDWVWYTGEVWEQYWSGGMGSGVKRYGRNVADDALSDIFFEILAHGSVSIAPRCPFPQKRGRHRGLRGPR